MTLPRLIEVANFSAVGYPALDPLGKHLQRFRSQVDRPPDVLGQERAWLQVRPADRQDQVLVRLRLDPHAACAMGPPDRDFLTKPRVNRERDPRMDP